MSFGEIAYVAAFAMLAGETATPPPPLRTLY
jgi:hypothetical protein